jgi:hypothetical protein
VSQVILRACGPGCGITQDRRKRGSRPRCSAKCQTGAVARQGPAGIGIWLSWLRGHLQGENITARRLSHRLTARAGSTSAARSRRRRERWCEAERGGTGSGEVMACGLPTRAGVHDGGTETGSCRKTAARRPDKGRCKKEEETCAALICAKHRTRGGHATVRLLKMHPSH